MSRNLLRRLLLYPTLAFVLVVLPGRGSSQTCSANILQKDTTVCAGAMLSLTASTADTLNSCNTYSLDADLLNGLLGWYPFCGNTLDEGPNGINGFATGALTYGPDRYNTPNDAIEFTGNGESVRTDHIDRTTTNSFSYVVWIKTANAVTLPAETTNPGSGFSTDLITPCVIPATHGYNWNLNDEHTGAGLYIANNGVFVLEHAASIVATPLSWPVTLNGWHCVALVYNNHVPQLYIDANLVHSGLTTSYTVHPSMACDSFFTNGTYPYLTCGFGKGFNPNTVSVPFNNFNGAIDDIKIYSRALTQQEITALYAKDKYAVLWSTGDTTATITVSPQQTTTYSVSFTNVLGSCNSSVQVAVKSCLAQSTCDSLPILTPDTSVCPGASFQLAARNALSYSWSPSKGLSDTGVQDPVCTPDSSRIYTLTTINTANNLVVNGNFEAGNTGFYTSYQYCNSNNCLYPLADNGYAVGTNANFYHNLFTGHDHTTGTGNFMIVNGADPTLTVWRETINVMPNTTYAFGCWISTMIDISPAQIRFSINGQQLGPIYNAPAALNTWDQFYITWNSGASTTATIEIVDVLPVSNGNDFGLDDIFFGQLYSCSSSVHVDLKTQPAISIEGPGDTICTGAAATFTATVTDPGGQPGYQWQVNGAGAGTNASTFVSSSLPNGAQVQCFYSNDQLCPVNTPVPSNALTLVVAPPVSPTLQITATADTICAGLPVTFTAVPGEGGATPLYAWSLNGAPVGSGIARYENSNLTTGDVIDCSMTSSLACSTPVSAASPIVMTIGPSPAIDLPRDTALCEGQTLLLDVTNPNATYLWQDGSTSPTFTVTEPGTYLVKVTESGCDTAAALVVSYTNKPLVSLPTDTTICTEAPLVLHAAYAQSSYLWQDGSTGPDLTVTATGVYVVLVKNGCGVTSDTAVITAEDCGCKFYVPNAFTPNHDGHNDVFQPKFICSYSSYFLQVFSRWGLLEYTSKDPGSGWDGTRDGRNEPDGTYVWVLVYQDSQTGKTVKKSGTVILIR